jgi:biopolymer transport protein ExbB/TolQ
MDQQTLITVMTVFVIVAAIALIIQAVALVGVFMVMRQLRSRVFGLWPQLEEILASAKRTTQGAEKNLDNIGSASLKMLDLARDQLVKVDGLVNDASTRAKVQMERAEMVLDDTMTRVQSTVSVVQRGVLRPIREVHGVLSGVRTAINHLGKANRSTVDHATSDEEMFI